ncbi:MAG: aminodeoxychorismate synthase component I, partial [Clostridiales bacterium]
CIEQVIKNKIPCENPEKNQNQIEVLPNFTKPNYKETVANMIEYITEGDIYIANMTQQLLIRSHQMPFKAFLSLRRNNPSPFGGYLNYGCFKIISASPERFMKMHQNKIETRPIKGTRKRGLTPDEDKALKTELQQSEKDKSELLMIVDLERNDLNKVCIPGSVKVTELFAVEEYATVFHLVSTIEGKLQRHLNAIDLIDATFPGGSITGAPKIRAMEIIDELENDNRNLYTGSFGYISLNGDMDLNIVIRTAIYKDGVYHLGVGGGITCESETEFEYEETLQKAKAILEALK